MNTVNGTVPGGSVVQGRNVDVDHVSYGGDHVDFRGGTFHDPVTGKQTNTSHPGPGTDHRQEPNR
ncbi:hypothetical protein CGQ36_20875 [Nocardiopsis dassonvillei]|nr:hypothetical protein CGQ36_20875 [Nocardiopsis dassonvillei]